uniref:UDP-xylose and UDP-N-acetylglucosamine transporter n=1 Tax=Plectus sambesii TaxID=2011161 RepID=A0A914X4M3_9BILA
MSALIPIGGTLTGCIGCMVFVESLAKQDPGCMHLMTFATFLFVALEGLIFASKFLTVKNRIPIRGYMQVAIVFFVVNVINNWALTFHVPVPLHIIFRSGSLLASLLLGKLILKRTYSLRKYISVFLITVGIIVCTLADSGLEKKAAATEHSQADATKHYIEWVIGITMLSVALLMSAYLGICQERLYSAYGKHSREAMFYVHALTLPGFALFGNSIVHHANMFSNSPHWTVLGFDSGVPILWAQLFATCVLQWVCIRFVYRLTSEVPSLTVTLVVTLRKFLSLLLSIWFFNNPFTPTHWVGTVLVFAGTLAFSDIWPTSKAKAKAKGE